MAEQTAIEWCDATFNPWWGCEKVSPGCAHCYAEKVSNHRSGRGSWGADHGFRFFGDKHWAEPLKWARNLPAKLGRRPRVFCASMADVFEERSEVGQARERLFALIAATPELDWLVLTKRPDYARGVLGHPQFWFHVNVEMLKACVPVLPGDPGEWARGARVLPNLWMGVSIENARFTHRADVLREIPAAVRFISAEPLLGSLYPYRPAMQPFPSDGSLRANLNLDGIDWVIIGGESGPGARPFHLEHAREIIRAIAELPQTHWDVPPARPAIFVKQLGARPVIDYDVDGHPCSAPVFGIHARKGGDWDEWVAKAPDLRIREFPGRRCRA